MGRPAGSKNRKSAKTSRTGLRGVRLRPDGKFRAELHLGTYASRYEAALAWNEAARELFGRHVYQNPLPEDEEHGNEQ